MTLDQEAPRPPINPPRDLAIPGRCLSSALALLDRITPLLASQPAELVFDATDRDGQVAAFAAWRDAVADRLNAGRRARWRAAYGGKEWAPKWPNAVVLDARFRAALAMTPARISTLFPASSFHDRRAV